MSISSLLRQAVEIGLDEEQKKRDAVLIETLIILRSEISSKDDELAQFVKHETQLNLEKLYRKTHEK